MASGIGSKLATNSTSQGGVSPQQQAAAQFHGAEESVHGASEFSQIPNSTNATFATSVGPQIQTAYDLMRMSDADAAAMQSAQSSKNSSTLGGISSIAGGLGGKLGGM